MMQLGLVGVGPWGTRWAETIARSRSAGLVKVARRTASDNAFFGGVPLVSNWVDLLSLDGIVVATTPANQYEIAEAAIHNGTPAILEKPLGSDWQDARNLLDAWQRSVLRTPLFVNYVHLRAHAFLRLQREIGNRGGPKQIRSIFVTNVSNGPIRTWSTLLDFATHDIAMLLQILAPTGLAVESASRRVGRQSGMLYSFKLTSESVGIHLNVGNGALRKLRRLEVICDDGTSIVYDDVAVHPNKIRINGQSLPISRELPMDNLLASFVSAIALPSELGSTKSDLELTVEVLRLLNHMQACLE